MKKLIERDLPFAHRYVFKSISRSEDGYTCANCGKPIVNIATVLDNTTKQTHLIGIDCCNTLKEATSLQGVDTYEVEVYKFNQCIKVVTEIKKGKQFDCDDLFVRVLNDKQKVITCYTKDLKKFYPEIF